LVGGRAKKESPVGPGRERQREKEGEVGKSSDSRILSQAEAGGPMKREDMAWERREMEGKMTGEKLSRGAKNPCNFDKKKAGQEQARKLGSLC